MLPCAAPLTQARVMNKPAVFVTAGQRNQTSDSTALNLAGAKVGDLILVSYFHVGGAVAGGAGNWTTFVAATGRVTFKRLEAADLVPGALSMAIAPWAFAVWRGPRSCALRVTNASSSSPLTVSGFTKHRRSAGVVYMQTASGGLINIPGDGWMLRKQGWLSASGFNLTVRLYDKLPPGNTYTNGSSVSASNPGGGASAGAALIELLNLGPDPGGVEDNVSPTITSSNALSVEEGETFTHTLTADEPVTWSLVGGADQALFSLVSSTLSMVPRDHATTEDADTNNIYVVQVRATDAAGNFTNQTITVTVTEVSEGEGQTLEDIVGLEAHLWSFFAKDAPVGTVDEWTRVGTHVRTATAASGEEPSKADADADVVFTGGQPHRLSWAGGDGNPSEPDATVAHRWGGFIAKITPSGSEYITVGAINGTSGNANHQQPFIYAKGAAQKLGVQWFDSAVRYVDGDCEADADAYQFIFWLRRQGLLYANVNGVWQTPVAFQSGAWNNVSAASFIGALKNSEGVTQNMGSTVGLKWWGMGQSEISDEVADKMVGLIARYAERLDLLVAADHPYAETAPTLTEADFSDRRLIDEAAFQAFKESGTQGASTPSSPDGRFDHRGEAEPTHTGYVPVFFDDFLTNSLVQNETGGVGRNWYGPLEINPGANVNITAANREVSDTTAYQHSSADGGYLRLGMYYSSGWRSGSFASTDHNGIGRTWQYPMIREARFRFVMPDTGPAEGLWAGCPWSYSRDKYFWRTRGVVEFDDMENDGASGSFHNVTLHIHNADVPGTFDIEGSNPADNFEKLVGYDVDPAHDLPELDWWDGEWHVVTTVIEEDFTYGYLDGFETFRVPTPPELKVPLNVNFNWAYDVSRVGSNGPNTAKTYYMDVDYMRVWQPASVFEVVPEEGFTARPAISGTPVTGQLLTATPNAVATRSGQLVFRWCRDDGSTVPDATEATYMSGADDVGFRLRYQVINVGVLNQPSAWSDFTDVIEAAIGPWTLNDLESDGDLKFNFSALDHASLGSPSDGAAISAWNDLGPEGRHAAQATSGKQPTYVAASDINGQPAVRFVSANDPAMTFSAPGTGGDALRYGGAGNAFLQASVLGGGTTTAQSPVRSTATAYITLFAWTTTHHYWFVNGSLVADAASTNPNSGMVWSVDSADSQGGGNAARLMESGVIGNRSSGTGRAWDGDIGALGSYIGDWDDALRQDVDGRLAHDFDLTTLLPVDHDHKTDEPMLGEGGGPAQTLNPADKGAHLTLSGGDLTMERDAGTESLNELNIVRSTLPIVGKEHAEFTCNHLGTYVPDNAGAGITDLTTAGVDEYQFVQLFNVSGIYTNWSNDLVASGSFAEDDVITIDANADTKEGWIGVNGTPLHGDPVAGTGGIDLSALAELFWFVAGFNEGDSFTANFGATAFAHPTAGFSGRDA